MGARHLMSEFSPRNILIKITRLVLLEHKINLIENIILFLLTFTFATLKITKFPKCTTALQHNSVEQIGHLGNMALYYTTQSVAAIEAFAQCFIKICSRQSCF